MNDWKDLMGGFIYDPKFSHEEARALKGRVYYFSPTPARLVTVVPGLTCINPLNYSISFWD